MNERKRIVIVEDELHFAKLVKMRLEKVGYKVTIALDTYLGMREIVKNEPDLVILDLMMPAGGGRVLLQRMRGNPVTVTIPVVILTAVKIDEEIRSIAEMYDVEELFQKPYDPAKFVDRIMQLVPA